ncbi:MAG: flavin reductase family protein [Cyclobacteriaceae bacterium]
MHEYKSFDPENISTGSMHQYLLAAVAPRPIAFASTVDSEGNINLSPFSFFNAFSANPPILVFSPARRGRDNTTKHTYDNVKEVPEVVINIVNYAIVEQMSLSSTEYEKGVNEFIKSGLTEIGSDLVKPPRVAESPVAFECKVDRVIELGSEGGAGNLVICKIVKVHIQAGYLDSNSGLDTTKLDLVGRMGGSWYTRASGESLFEIPKPLTTRGIGIDQLPDGIRQSTVLTGNNLGRLGNLEVLPELESIPNSIQNTIDEIKSLNTDPLKFIDHAHRIAKKHLDSGDTQTAIEMLIYTESQL